MTENVNYTELGSYCNWIADRKKSVRGPYNIAEFMEQEAGSRGYNLGVHPNGKPRKLPQGGAVSKYFRGLSFPEPWWVKAFADLFGLDDNEREELADHYAYRFRVAA